MTGTDVIAYTADASILHPQCAIKRYNKAHTVTTTANYVDAYGHLYGYDGEGNEIHPIFAYESHNVSSDTCDACMQPIVDD